MGVQIFTLTSVANQLFPHYSAILVLSMKLLKLLKFLNIIVSILIAIIALYILVRPLFPNIVFSIGKDEGYTYQSEEAIKEIGDRAKDLPQIPKENRLVIPKIHVNALITEGANQSALMLGMWHRPDSSTPNKGGNTVITGHRFLYTKGPDTLYYLDRVEMNDKVIIYWEEKEYVYKVFQIIVVNPDQIEIENNTKASIITLYTCTPLWTSEKRLVVKAELQ